MLVPPEKSVTSAGEALCLKYYECYTINSKTLLHNPMQAIVQWGCHSANASADAKPNTATRQFHKML